MAYVNPNFKSGAALKRALKAGEHIEVFQPGLGTIPLDGVVYIEGPHYPKPHTWYLAATMADGKLVKVK